MKRMIFGIALLFACSVHAQKMSDYISIKGEYLQKVEPDRLVLTVKLDEKDSKGKRSLAGQQRDMLRELKKLHGEIEALNNARRKAERLAATEGRRVGKCFYISDNKSYSSAEEFSLPRSGFMEDEMLDITRYDSKSSEESLLLPLTIGDVQIYSTVFAAFTLE